MKRNLLSAVVFAVIVGSFPVRLSAQQGSSATLDDAITLFNGGRHQEARQRLESIDRSAPEYEKARCYKALCLYELNERFAFWQEMNSMDLQRAPVSPALREDLAFKQIDTLFYFRKFDSILGQIKAFEEAHPSSARLDSMAEFRLASLFERGMKKTEEACRLNDQAQFDRRWTMGRQDLERFLSLAPSFTGTNYSHLPKRGLQRDIWVARMTLGDEEAAMAEIPAGDEASREKLSLLRVQLYKKLQPDQLDQNIGLMSDFVRQFPESEKRRRVEFDLATLAFRKGEQLSREAAELEETDSAGAAEKRSVAATWFRLQRSLQMNNPDDDLEIGASDILDMRGDLLYGYFLEQDYANVSALTSQMIEESSPGELPWIMAKVYEGIVLLHRNPPQSTAAAGVPNEVLAHGFTGKPDHDKFLALAVKWRVHIALTAGDKEEARKLVASVRSSECTQSIKDKFVAEHAGLARSQASDSN